KLYCKKIFRMRLDCLKLRPHEDLAIKLRHFNQPLIEFVVHLFPNIKQLVFSCTTQLESPQLAYFLQQWPNLTDLALHGDVDFETCVFEAFKQLPALRRLYLLIRSAEKPLPASLMSQLDHF